MYYGILSIMFLLGALRRVYIRHCINTEHGSHVTHLNMFLNVFNAPRRCLHFTIFLFFNFCFSFVPSTHCLFPTLLMALHWMCGWWGGRTAGSSTNNGLPLCYSCSFFGYLLCFYLFRICSRPDQLLLPNALHCKRSYVCGGCKTGSPIDTSRITCF